MLHCSGSFLLKLLLGIALLLFLVQSLHMFIQPLLDSPGASVSLDDKVCPMGLDRHRYTELSNIASYFA